MDAPLVWIGAWLALSFIVARVWAMRGHSYVSGLFVSLLFSPLVGLLIAIAMPVKKEEKPAERTPSGRLRAVGTDFAAWDKARKEGRLCAKCNAVLLAPLETGEKCPECYARKG